MKKIVLSALALSLMSTPAFALMPLDGENPFWAKNTAYNAVEFAEIMSDYGVEIDPADPALSQLNTAYKPYVMNEILESYDLILLPEKVMENRLDLLKYAMVVDGQVMLNDTTSVAYGAAEWARILDSYAFVVLDSDGDGVPNEFDECPNTPLGAVVDARGCWSHAGEFLFNFDSAVIHPEYKPILDEVAMVLKGSPAIVVRIDGYTDSTGPAEYNMMLSEKRAESVMMYLVEQGIDPLRLSCKAFGETDPAFPNDTEEGRMKNRRVVYTTM